MTFQVAETAPLTAFVSIATAWLVWSAPAAARATGSRGWPAPVLALIAGAAAAATATLLARTTAGIPHAILLFWAMIAAWLLALRWYGAGAAELGGGARLRLAALRGAAWAVALLIIAQPSCSRLRLEWEKPLLVALLDQSNSMRTVDHGQSQSRYVLANSQLIQCAATWEALADRYELQVRDLSGATSPWALAPFDSTSPFVAAVRAALQARSANGDAPEVILVLGDGGAPEADADEQKALSRELSRRQVAVAAVGVGPGALGAAAIEIERLEAPARVAPGDRFVATARAAVRGLAGRTLRAEWLWDGAAAGARSIVVGSAEAPLVESIELRAPRAGLLRLTLRLAPEDTPQSAAARSVQIDARRDPLRVLWLEERPRPEQAFAGRALRGAQQIELSAPALTSSRDPAAWGDVDVFVVGDAGAALDADAFSAIATACRENGAGVLLAGGIAGLSDARLTANALGAMSPLDLARLAPPREAPLRVVPTAGGLAHPILAGCDPDAANEGRRAVEVKGDGAPWGIWAGLSPLGGAATPGDPRPLAQVIATDERGAALLAVQEVGRGRIAVACWSGTWPWALGSDVGAAVHRRFWLQLVEWLANRRPQPWVATDEPSYASAALAAGHQVIRIRAGLSNAAAGDAAPTPRAAIRQITPDEVATSAPASAAVGTLLRLRASAGNEWVAEAPSDLSRGLALAPGVYEVTVTFEMRGAERSAAKAPGECSARARFDIEDSDLEMRQPNANLTFLRELAASTASFGGVYHDVAELPALLESLRGKERGRAVERRIFYDPLANWAAWALLAVVAAFGVEWLLRRRVGLA